MFGDREKSVEGSGMYVEHKVRTHCDGRQAQLRLSDMALTLGGCTHIAKLALNDSKLTNTKCKGMASGSDVSGICAKW